MATVNHSEIAKGIAERIVLRLRLAAHNAIISQGLGEYQEHMYGKTLVEEIEAALTTAVSAEREALIRAAQDAPCNAMAKYTCCLENGLNARNIIIDAMSQRGRE